LSLRRDKTPVNVLASDLQTLRALCDHWRTLAPALSGAERDHLRTALDEALTHLETLRQTLIAEQLHAEIIHLKS